MFTCAYWQASTSRVLKAYWLSPDTLPSQDVGCVCGGGEWAEQCVCRPAPTEGTPRSARGCPKRAPKYDGPERADDRKSTQVLWAAPLQGLTVAWYRPSRCRATQHAEPRSGSRSAPTDQQIRPWPARVGPRPAGVLFLLVSRHYSIGKYHWGCIENSRTPSPPM